MDTVESLYPRLPNEDGTEIDLNMTEADESDRENIYGDLYAMQPKNSSFYLEVAEV